MPQRLPAPRLDPLSFGFAAACFPLSPFSGSYLFLFVQFDFFWSHHVPHRIRSQPLIYTGAAR